MTKMASRDKQWDGSERRASQIQPKVPHHVSLDDIWSLLQAHTQEMEIFRTKVERGFPKNKHGEPDFEGHGEYHEKLIERAVNAELRNERLQEKFLGGSLWAAVVVMGGWMFNGAIEWLKAHLK